MRINPPIVSVISDEIARSLDDVLAFAAEENLTHLEIRQLDGTNILMLSEADLATAAHRIRQAGLAVVAIATPLFKWPGPGQPYEMVGDTFGFEPRSRDLAGHMQTAVQAAKAFGARRLRIFSYLTYPGFTLADLDADLALVLRMAADNGLDLMMEDEPVCNLQRADHLAAALDRWRQPNFKALYDLGNLASIGAPRLAHELAAILPRTDHLHVKDWSVAANKAVPFGEGDIGFPAFLADCLLQAGPRQLTLSIETHVREGGGTEATRRSLRRLRETLARISADPRAVLAAGPSWVTA